MSVKILVNFIPNAAMTNELIAQLNSAVPRMSGQDFATNLSSHIAAIAFVLHSNNPPGIVKEIFNGIIDDATRKYEARKKALVEAEKVANDDGPTEKPN